MRITTALCAAAAVLATGATGVTVGAAPATASEVSALPRCPLVFGHGGYPEGANGWAKDQIRQPNGMRGLDDQKSWGADGVEADVQLTKEGTKAVMWHNSTTHGLTGKQQRLTDIWWTYGAGNLAGRRIVRGPYQGERIYSLRQWLDRARSLGLVALLEIKPETKPVLTDPAFAAQGWKEISDPIRERQGKQRIMVYSDDPWIQSELARRHPALLKGSAARWTDSVHWTEPAPSWKGNVSRWQAVLDQSPGSVMTNYPKEYRAWLRGKCR
ncbi:glycerophosphodiester phosphodiesterase family protein [Microbispora sp. NPDC046973]|uniref:glycerophosphodiester phosphodiesterase n=1 Tax=Microbispora sp. NPDC046973 TaxID=3155022 RepID=UPI0033FE3D2B